MNKPNKTNSATKATNTEVLAISEFEVTGVKQFDNGGVVFNIKVNGITIYGCRVVETENGDFISLPQRKGTDGKYYSIVWARFSKEDSEKILREVENQL